MLSMKGGKGEASYVNNSQAQAQHARSMLHLLRETLDGVRLQSPPDFPFVVADLGCSCGSNTIYMVDVIIQHMTKRYEAAGCDPPEFSAFFSDLPSNDFNTSSSSSLPTAESAWRSAWLPTATALTSPPEFQVPDVVLDKRSTAYNKGRIFIHGASESTANAYKKQFQSDLAGFLRSRSKEMKSGGSMFLVCLGRTCSDPTDQGGAGLLFGTHFQDAWDDLVQEGLITSEKRDNFNIPVYAPSLEDFKEVVEADGSFIVNKLEVFRGGSPLVVNHPDDAAEIGRALANSCRSVSGVLVDAHIGDQLSDELFSRVVLRATRHAKELLEQLQFFHIVASLSLA
ncbi:UNVERIFIED_CONTAM: Indole-3-acetate O-methyltransferase 1 [Sesamum radiatum]|uniref:Indole-3-acetate O-methyltransferase 1 n=1 Tax=Sesamum radiatum TaxID=300843 RepID=A0AAW2T357_SESRA